ncbi:MAG: HlyD family secretion protein, partial [Candidatus Electrothrix sp. AS4_5]|nr:HlyD family secretion protein [Candidatus Electrothrix gigas]
CWACLGLFGETSDWIGKAVTIGEQVIQIADPTQVEITIQLPISDAIRLDEQAQVKLYLTSNPQTSYQAKLYYYAYQPEVTPSNIVAYKLKARFDGEYEKPRLGQSGTAKLYGERVPFIYYIMRKPLAALRQWIGW